jgi:RNA polymerase sigma-70 factor (ECF subfamily)
MPRRAEKSTPPKPPAKSPVTKPPVKAPADEPSDLQPAILGKSSDEDLMRRTQQTGDKAAFSILYERYSTSVLSYLYRMLGNLEDVESIGQEVFFRAFRFAPTYRYPQKFSTWLFTITRNLAINSSRRRKRSPVRNITELNLEGVDLSGDPYQVASRATDDVEKQEEIARVLKALDGLPTDQKEVIVLGVFQDLSYAQMEEITGTKAVTLRSRMFHGLKKLAGMIGGSIDRHPKDEVATDDEL